MGPRPPPAGREHGYLCEVSSEASCSRAARDFKHATVMMPWWFGAGVPESLRRSVVLLTNVDAIRDWAAQVML